MSMRGGGKFLRPPPGGGGQGALFESSGSSDSEEDDEEEQAPQPSGRKKPSANLSSDEDEEAEEEEAEEDDDDDDEDYDDAPASKKRKGAGASGGGEAKKAKKINTRAFFDMEAEADDDDEDVDEPYGTHHDPDDVVRRHYTEEDIRKEQLDEEAEELIRQQDRRRAQAGGGIFSRDMSAADVAREIEERHRMQRRTVATSALDDEGGEGEGFERSYGAVAQQSLVPSVSDPSMWMFTCAPGKEQELVYQIMNKCIAFAGQGKPLGITGAVAAQSKGRIYVESYSEPAVIEAMQGIRNLMQYSMRLVPISDMTTVMTVIPKKKPVKKNDWVRMSRGHFKGDLALVKAVRDSGLKCIIQCVPRIDLTLSDLPPDEARVRRRTVRPPQKFFNPQEIANLGKHSLRQRFPGLGDIYCDYFEGNYYHDGYLLKEVTVGTMVKPCGEDEPPTLDELQAFRRRKGDQGYDDEGEENDGSKMASSLLDQISELQGQTGLGSKSSGGGLIIGDTVEVIEGDLVGMRGKLMSIDGSTVKVRPTNASDLGDTAEVEFLSSQVRKHIAVGNHVKVTDGRYANETGVVVAVEQLEGDSDPTAVVLTDMTNKEISVRTSQLQESAEVASGQDKLAGYELHDLVVLSGGGSANEVGVIVRVGREDFTVVNNHGIVREIRPEELRGKRNASSNRAVALDVQGNQIRVGDTVGVAEGPHKGKTATIKRMSRAQLFLYSQTRTENAGIFVVRSRSCVLAGSRAQNRAQPGDGGVSPFSTPQSQSGKGGPPGARGRREDGLIGKTVRIQAGQWKGYLGAVSDATPTHVQVELHSRLKKVMVVRERVAVVGDKFGSTEDPNRDNPSTGSSMLAPSTPFLGGATPMHGGATPMHGGATPMHDGMGGGFTPSHPTANDDVWRPGGSIDRAPINDGSDDADGSSGDGVGGWGSSGGGAGGVESQQSSDPFAGTSSTGADGDGGWGSSSADQGGGSTWAPSTGEESRTSTGGFAGDASSSTGGQDSVPGAQASRGGSTMDTAAAMGNGDSGEEAAVWFMERVCVQLKKDDSPAVIKEIGSNNSAVVELEDKSTVTVRAGEVSMVPPKEKDMVLVTGGADVGVEGELVCIDGTDAILKDSNEDFKIVDFVHLAKIVGDT